ncbi:MAG TPA: hypothetical protein DCK93_02125, partial [Blastocatellia bacterium]|nr:hypothetical protein [Blastocatellia bacterium]
MFACKYHSGKSQDYPASLELHKIYRVLPDEDAATDGDIRVVDESGEDYLYPLGPKDRQLVAPSVRGCVKTRESERSRGTNPRRRPTQYRTVGGSQRMLARNYIWKDAMLSTQLWKRNNG